MKPSMNPPASFGNAAKNVPNDLSATFKSPPASWAKPPYKRGMLSYNPLAAASEMINKANKAAQDAPAVSMALDQTVKTAATAAHALSPMEANQEIKSTIFERRTILKAPDA